MSARNLKQESHLFELASSLHLALKLSILILALVWFATTPLALGLICILFAVITRLVERRLQIQDSAYLVLAGCGLFYGVLALSGIGVNLDNGTRLWIFPIAALFIFYLAYTLRRQPFTQLFAGIDSIPVLRQQHSALWLTIYGATTVAWLFMPAGALPWLATLLALTGLIMHLYLQLVGVGPAWEPIRERHMGEFRFVRVHNNDKELEPLYSLYVKELMPSLMEGDRFHNAPESHIVQEKMQADRSSWNSMVFFTAYHNQTLVGTLCCQFDNPSGPLPFENSHSQPLSLNKIREIGGIVELGKFCVAEDYRLMPEVFSGLLLCAVEMSLSRGVAFVVLQSVMRSARIYSKLGFALMTKEPVTNLDHGVKVQLLAKNMATPGDVSNPIMGNAEGNLSQYVFSRFVWRQILQSILGRTLKKTLPSSVSSQDLPALAEFQ